MVQATVDNQLEAIARRQFPADRFVRVNGDKAIFAEHTTTGPDGTKVEYDRAALQDIVDRCNRRILDTGDFAVLCDGHTPEREEQIKGAAMPEVLGFVGPFRLGRIGNVNPRYAIFADEFHFKDRAQKVSRLPRRSVELWMSRNPRERFFDPIAALGAECPRLDLGLRYAKLPSGEKVLKYTAAAPGGMNTFIPGAETKYQQPTGAPSMLAPEDLQQILDAINSLDWVQFAKSQMQTSMAPGGEGPAAPAATPAPAGVTPPGAAATPPPPAAAGPPAPAPDPVPGEGAPLPEKKEEETGAYSKCEGMGDRMTEKTTQVKMSNFGDVERYHRQIVAENNELKQKYNLLQANVQTMQRAATDEVRKAKLEQLSAETAIELEDELNACLYSRNSKMDDAAFDHHVATIQKYARRIPLGESLPRGQVHTPSADRRSEEALSDRAVQIADRYRRQGKAVSYAEALNEAKAEGNGAAAK